MWSGRRKSAEQNKINYYNNQISQIFKPVNGVIPEILEGLTWLFNGSHMYNVNSGNVGIGTKTPLKPLDVIGTINTSSDFTINYVPIAPPIGSVTAYTVAISPPGWLICDGSGVSRLEYASLYSIIGTQFGSGDGSTTFNLPNYQGAFLRGIGTNGVYSGPTSIDLSQNHATQTHNHTASSTVTDPGHAHTQHTVNDDFNSNGNYPTTPGSPPVINIDTSNPSFAQFDSAGTVTWSNIDLSFCGITVATTVANSTTSVNTNETRPYNFGVYWIIKY